MKKRHGVSAAVAAALAITSSAANADSNLGAFAVGAAVGAIVNQSVNNNRQKKTQRTYSGQSSYTRQQNRETQAALNAFGFNAGVVDGALGSRSRAAISSYQAYMGYPVSGYLQGHERVALVGAHQRLMAGGGTAYPQVVANEGTRGLLKAFSDPNYASKYNQAPPTTTTTAAVTTPVPAPAPVPVPAPAPAPTTAAAATTEPVTSAALAPLDLTATQPQASIVRHCDTVNRTTRANNGVILASNITNPDQALGEQFCAARDYSIDQLFAIQGAANLTDEQILTACGQITNVMTDITAKVDRYTIQRISAEANEAVIGLANGDMDTAAGYGQLCMGMGYREDNADMALAGAVVMMGVGQMPYAEMVGHHLRWGFGTEVAPIESAAWYNTALTAMDNGATPAVLPAEAATRNAVINAAINSAGSTPQPVQASGGGLPTLSLGNN